MKIFLVTLWTVLLCFGVINISGATAITIDVSVDGTAQDTNGDGVFDSVSTADNDLLYGLVVRQFSSADPFFEDRALVEFDISSLTSGDSINSVSLVFNQTSWANPGPIVNVLGYSGDGTISTSDATAAGIFIGSYDPTSGNGIRSVNLDPSFLESLIGVSNLVGLRLQGSGYGVNTSLSSIEQGAYGVTISHLDISYTPVPEPTTMLLLASGLVGLVGFRRFKK